MCEVGIQKLFSNYNSTLQGLRGLDKKSIFNIRYLGFIEKNLRQCIGMNRKFEDQLNDLQTIVKFLLFFELMKSCSNHRETS